MSTDEQEARAMDLATSTIANVKELLKRSDLPASAFDPVFRLYIKQLEGVVLSDAKTMNAEYAERVAKVAAIRAACASAMQAIPGRLQGPASRARRRHTAERQDHAGIQEADPGALMAITLLMDLAEIRATIADSAATVLSQKRMISSDGRIYLADGRSIDAATLVDELSKNAAGVFAALEDA